MKILFRRGFLAATLAFASTAFATSSPNETSAVGINLNGLNYWSTQWALLDVMKQASNGSGALWATSNADNYNMDTGHQARLNLDAQGWPVSLPARNDPDFHYVTTIIYQDNAYYPAGEYVVLYEGEGELQYSGVTRMADKSSPGRDVVRLTENSFFHLQIRSTDPNHNGNYLKNIRVIVPGGICAETPTAYAESANDCAQPDQFATFEQIYQHQSMHPLYLQDLSQFRALRFMQMMQTIASEQRVWGDRPQLDDATWATTKGIPIEFAVDLANKTQAEPWLNIPVRVDDDYVQRYAQLVKETLDEHLDVRIELGNEIWNDAYPYNIDANWMEAKGRATWPNVAVSAFEFRLNYFGKRSAEVCHIWKTTFGEEADRVHCVMGGFVANTWVNQQILECPLWASSPAGHTCASNMDALAIGAYFGGYVHEDRYRPLWLNWLDEGAASGSGNQIALNKLFEEINTGILRDLTYDPGEPDWAQAPMGGSLAQTRRFIEQNAALAAQYDLELVAYEGGQHLTFAGDMRDERARINEELLLAGNRDSRMGDAFTHHFTDWRNAGGALYMVFESVGRWGAFGAFPLKEHQRQPLTETPKLVATLDFIDQNPCWWENCERFTNAYERAVVLPLPSTGTEPDPQPQPDPQPEPIPDQNGPLNLQITAQARPESWGIGIDWHDIANEAGDSLHSYQIFRDGVYIGGASAAATHFNNDWLALRTPYQFQVKALNPQGEIIAESNIVQLMAGDSEAPSQPANVAVTFNGAYGFNVTWGASSDNTAVAYYKIYRNGQPYTVRDGLRLEDEWPPLGESNSVSYQIIAYDHFHNGSIPSEVVIGHKP